MGGLSAPERFSRAVLGGIPLFDVEATLQALGMARDAAEYDAAFSRSAQGDWEAFWSVFPLPLPDGTKRMLESRNDVAAITAATWAARSEPFVFTAPDVPTFAYWGDGEIFHGLNVDAAEGWDGALTYATVSGGHAEAFADIDATLEIVRPFLHEAP